MNRIVKRIKDEFSKTPDLKIKEIKINLLKSVYVVFIETVCSSDKINDYILKNLSLKRENKYLNSEIPGPNTVKLKNYDEIEYYITSGFAIVISDDEDEESML